MRGVRFFVAVLAIFGIVVSSFGFVPEVRAGVEDLSAQQKAKVYSILNSQSKITKITTSGSSISIKWNPVSISGIKYQTAIKTYEGSFSYTSTNASKKTFRGLSRGRLYVVSVRPYAEVGGIHYYGKWAPSRMKRVKIRVSYSQIRANYRAYRHSHGLTDGCYRIKDIDNNGVPEMLFRNTRLMGVYSADKNTGEVKRLREVRTWKGTTVPLYYSAGRHMVFLSTYNNGGGQGWLYKIKGKRAVRIQRFDYTNGHYEPKSYQIDGSYVTAAVYNQVRGSITGDFTRLIYSPRHM